MSRLPARQSLQRTTAVAVAFGFVLATAPIVPMLDADGALALSSGAAYAKGRGGGRGGHGDRGHGHSGHSDRGKDDSFGRDHRDQDRDRDRQHDRDDSHAVGRTMYVSYSSST